MPPKKRSAPLAVEKTDLLREWIDQGAPWPSGLTLIARKAEEARKAFGAKLAFTDFRALCASNEIDAVAVCVRVPSHYEPTRSAIEAGKHVYTEWPLGKTTAEAEELAALARAKGEGTPSRSPAASGPGAAVYAGACAGCHGEAGRAPAEPALNLALSTSVSAVSPNNLVRVILGGIQQADNRPGPHMPGFAAALTDKQTADLVAYVRASFTERPAFAGVDVTIRKARE